MRYFWVFLLLFAISITSSCVIDGSFRGLYSYYEVTKSEHPNFIQKPGAGLCELTSGDSIIVYKINGSELKNCLRSEPKSLVYFWDPNCGAPFCVPPNFAQEYSTEKNLELFIVATYYDYSKMAINYDLVRPVFGVDTEFYRTNLTDRYMKRFREDLFNVELIEEENPRFVLFQSDSLIATSQDLEELEVQ
jgi:hypothetical protein